MAYNGTIVGSPTFAASKFNNGLSHSSATDYISFPSGLLTGLGSTPTYNFWIKATATGGFVNLIQLGSIDYCGMTPSGTLFFSGFGQLTYTDTGSPIGDGSSFHHIEVTYTGTAVKVFVDGVQVHTATTGYVAPDGVLIQIGNPNASTTYSFDELSFWNVCLHSSGFTVPSAAYTGSESNLLALYHLETDGTDSAGGTTTPITLTKSDTEVYSDSQDYFLNLGNAYNDTINYGDTVVVNLGLPNIEELFTDTITFLDNVVIGLSGASANSFDRVAIKTKVASFLNNPIYYKDIDFNDSIQDGVDEIVAFSGCNYGTALIPFVADLSYYDFATLISNFIGVIAIFNGTTKKWMNPTSLRKLDLQQPDWEIKAGTPEYFCPVNHRYVAIYKKPISVGYGNMYVLYRAAGPVLVDGTTIPVPYEYNSLIQSYVIMDLWEQNQEWTKASDVRRDYERDLMKLHNLVHSKRQMDRLPSL